MVTTRFGKLAVRVDGTADMGPLLLCQRFRGTMEDWDAQFISWLAVGLQVIRFDSAGIGESEGETPNTVAAMAEIVPALLDALGLDRTDVLGWSVGGYVAQTVALNWPQRLRRLVIAGSGPGGPDGPPPRPRVAEIAAKQVPTREDLRFLFFTTARPAWRRPRAISRVYELASTHRSRPNSGLRQREAIVAWWEGKGARSLLAELSLPVLVANGITDVMVLAEHSFAIARTAPNAKLVLYPDAGHAFLFQYAAELTREVLAFLCL